MTPQELKNSVLQLAIQGRLVEQRPEEGTAQVPSAAETDISSFCPDSGRKAAAGSRGKNQS